RGENSRLYRSLVMDKGLAISASAGYSGTALDYARLSVSGSPKPGVTLAQVEEAIDATIAEVIAKGVTADELDPATSRLIADPTSAQDNQGTLARWYGAALTTGGSIEQVSHWADQVRAVTPESVREAARQWFDKRRSVTGYLVKDNSPEEKRT